MKTLNFIAALFCLYASIAKGFKWLKLNSMKEQMDELSIELTSFDETTSLIWFIVFSILLLVWVYAFFRKSEKLKPWFVGLTIVAALGMSITDNIETKFYVSEIIVGGEELK